jgi:hypothetical protein
MCRGVFHWRLLRSLVWWSWGESNPRPSSGNCPRYDHSRGCGSRLPHYRVSWGRSPTAGSFPEVSGLSRRQPSFRLSPSASVAGLRRAGPVRHCWSLCLSTALDQAARANSPSAVLWLPPFKESEATPVARSSSRSRRRNRSAPDRHRRCRRPDQDSGQDLASRPAFGSGRRIAGRPVPPSAGLAVRLRRFVLARWVVGGGGGCRRRSG